MMPSERLCISLLSHTPLLAPELNSRARQREALQTYLPAMPQESIRQNASDHRFADRHGADSDAWIMSAFDDNLSLVARPRDRAARRKDR